jgi:cardiolipin synthase (CMP-forming)
LTAARGARYSDFCPMSSRILSPANEITILRLVFVPIFVTLVLGGHNLAALGVLVAAAVSDLADGLVARIFQQQSGLGMALDPIADKILMTSAFLVLSFRGVLPWWLTIVVITRDVGILLTAGVISLVAGYRPFRPSILGKASTGAQILTVFFALAYQAHLTLTPHWLVRAFVGLTAALAVASGCHYLFSMRHRFGSAEVSGENAPEMKVRVRSPSTLDCIFAF